MREEYRVSDDRIFETVQLGKKGHWVKIDIGDHLVAAIVFGATQEEANDRARHIVTAANAVNLALDRGDAAIGKDAPEPFAGLENYYQRLFQKIKNRHSPGTGGDTDCLIAMVEWLWMKYVAFALTHASYSEQVEKK
mgnify:CR=1 FL=1